MATVRKMLETVELSTTGISGRPFATILVLFEGYLSFNKTEKALRGN
jgi:hypothetical protein